MANPEHVAKLMEGVEAWNEWRADNRSARNRYSRLELSDWPLQPDLSGASLAGVDLSAADLTIVDLHGADLREAFLSEADLSLANLSEADLTCGFRGKPISIPGRCRSRFRDEADQRSDAMPITDRAFSES